MSNGCLMFHNSTSTTPAKNMTNDSCAWLRKWFTNVGNVNIIVSRVAVCLRIPGLKKKSLVKITSLIYNSHVKSIPWKNWFAQYARRRFGYSVSISIGFDGCTSPFTHNFLFRLGRNIKHSRQCFIGYPITSARISSKILHHLLGV